MQQAIISDIHSNLEALTAVFDDIKKQGVQDVICLGDVIGYGPNPRECVDIIRDRSYCIMGNHEEAVLNMRRASGFNPRAGKAVKWTVSQFDMLGPEKDANGRRWDFMGGLQRSLTGDGVLLVHGSPIDMTRGYIYTTDINDTYKMGKIFAKVDHLLFVGHSHVPGVWRDDMTCMTPRELNYKYEITSHKTIINVGSVGQPRDVDPRASYVLFDGSTVIFRRLQYDVQTTANKIYAIEDLDRFLGDRLLRGA
jgi:predicted phosphodiesterase